MSRSPHVIENPFGGTAMAYKATKLSMHEQLMLLALRDEKGTLDSRAGMHGYALGGEILAELVLAGRITLGNKLNNHKA